MCRLLGVIANKSVEFRFSFKKFKSLGERNPDGWGVGWYDNSVKANIKKEGCSTIESEIYDSLSEKIYSNLIIEHVRLATTGKICKTNSHPFEFNNWIFAHNGSVNRNCLLNKLEQDYRNGLIGDCTDSEVYFRFLLQSINKQGGDAVQGILCGLEKIYSIDGGRAYNFLLSDGKHLYAYRDGNSSYYSLYILKRFNVNPYDDSNFEALSKETQLLLTSKSLNREKAVVICSEKITDESNWEKIEQRELVIVDKNLNITRRKI